MFAPIPTPECTDDRDTDMSAFFTSENAMQIFMPLNLPDLTLIRGHFRQQQRNSAYIAHSFSYYFPTISGLIKQRNTFVSKDAYTKLLFLQFINSNSKYSSTCMPSNENIRSMFLRNVE